MKPSQIGWIFDGLSLQYLRVSFDHHKHIISSSYIHPITILYPTYIHPISLP